LSIPSSARRRVAAIVLLGSIASSAASRAEDAPLRADVLQGIVVIGTTPVPGTGVDIDKIPGNVQTLNAEELREGGTANLRGALEQRLSGISITDTLADPFQPDILYRGFEASPVLGAPQGLAVFQNGVRVNEAFGDAVNWDLIPDIAISRVDLVSANPSYGLNALGGSLAVTMKNAFSYRGMDAEVFGGSFNQRAASAEFGANDGRFGIYAAARVLHQNGWRRFANDAVHQFYLDLSVRQGAGAIDLSYSRTDNDLSGQGAAPVQELAVDRRLVFTGPQDNANRLDFFTLNASFDVNAALSVQSVLYLRRYRQIVANGNTTEYTACTSGQFAGILCQPDGLTPLVNSAGAPLPDITNDGTVPIGENDFEEIRSLGRGGSLQLSDSHKAGDHDNHFTAGVTYDDADVDFSSGSQIGPFDAALLVQPTNLIVDTPEGSRFAATPVSLTTAGKYYGIFATDNFDVSRALSISLSARYSVAQLRLIDQRGTELNGNNRFSHFNPAIGATYRLRPGLTAYISASVANRNPTTSEIECSNPLKPCLLPSSLAADPPNLKQVVARSAELGLRGRSGSDEGGAGRSFSWNLGIFRTTLDNDIYATATSLSSGFFQNIGSTRRQGVEAGFNVQLAKWSGYAQFSYVQATFESAFVELSASNPAHDANGKILVQPGDRLPGIPRQRFKAGASYQFDHRWMLGIEVAAIGGQYYRGDESNQNDELPGYAVVNMRVSFRPSENMEFFGSIKNVFDTRYATFGLFGNPTGVGAPGIPAAAEANDPRVDNRFRSPAAPRAFFGGIRVSF
jgi:iron complex outermembrane receptor protein